MQTLTLAPSKSALLLPAHLFVLLLRHPFSSSSSSSPFSRRRTEEESKAVKVSVWWDFENCNVPSAVNVYTVAGRIHSALRSTGIRGPVSITAFGDVIQLSRSTQEALISTGICLTHVPHSGKNSSDRSFMADLISFTSQNPPPCHFFLISSDKDFSTILHRLRMNNYNVILSSNDCASSALYSAASVFLPWGPLVRGEELRVKYFNLPPDGNFGSWYGNFRGRLDDPFEGSEEQMPISQPDETMEHINEIKPRTVPQNVINNILQIIHKYPNKIALSTLRDELRRKNIVQKDFYGYKKFSHLISSLSGDLRLVAPPAGENQPYVCARAKRVDPFEEKECFEPIIEPIEKKEGFEPIIDSFEKKEVFEQIEPFEKKEGFEPGVELSVEKSNEGILGTFRKILFGQEREIGGKSEERETVVSNRKDELKEKDGLNAKPKDELKEKGDLCENNDNNNDENNNGFFEWISKWWKFGREKEREKNHELFDESEFWENLKVFLTSPKGSDLVSKSQTREELKRALQKEGPLSLKDLKETDFTQLIDQLISDKKWIQQKTTINKTCFAISIPSNELEKLEENNKNNKNHSNRDEIISNFQKFINEMLDRNPHGFDMSLIKSRFEKKFGYELNYKELGYNKLVSLLEILPDVKVDLNSNKVYRKSNDNNNNNNKKERANGSATRGDNCCEFDELRPVSKDGVYYKPSLSEEEFSDELENESEKENKNNSDDNKSPLVQILDSWYGNKEKEKGFKENQELDGLVDCSRNNNNNNANNNANIINNDDIINIEELGLTKKPRIRVSRRAKSRYNFVPDESDEKEKLVDSILGGLKKAGDSRISAIGKGF